MNTSLQRWGLRLLAMSAGASVAIAVQSAVPGERRPTPSIHVDFAYNTADPELVAGDATVVAIATVERPVRMDDDRSVFEVRVAELLEGDMPMLYKVSQLGYRKDGASFEVEGFPLMIPGRTYVMALVAPAPNEPQDALIVLTAASGGNLLPVNGPQDRAADRYRRAVAGQRSPWLPADGTERKRADDYRRWREGAGG